MGDDEIGYVHGVYGVICWRWWSSPIVRKFMEGFDLAWLDYGRGRIYGEV